MQKKPNMTKKFLFFQILFFSFLCSNYGQDDVRSQKIIDDMATKLKTYPSVSLEFSATISSLQNKSETEQEGKLWLKSSKYKLETSEFVIFSDGSKNYNYMPAVKEVYVNPNENSDDFQLLNPQSYFNISSKSFKSKFIRETVQNKRNVFEIDLYPVQINTANYSRIRMMIEKTTLQMVYLKAFMNDGTNYTLSLKPYQFPQPALRDSFFTFNPLEYPGVEVIDLTF